MENRIGNPSSISGNDSLGLLEKGMDPILQRGLVLEITITVYLERIWVRPSRSQRATPTSYKFNLNSVDLNILQGDY